MARNYKPRPRRKDHREHDTRTTVSDDTVVFECLDCGVGIARPRCTRTNGKTGLRCTSPCHPGETACTNHERAEARRARASAAGLAPASTSVGVPAGEASS